MSLTSPASPGTGTVTAEKQHWTARDLAAIAMMAALIAVCSWISIPTTVPFTLQTMGIFLATGLLGGRRGTASVLVYILLGLVGFPVFAGFTGGPGILMGTTGGYITGFLFAALAYWGIIHLAGKYGNRSAVMVFAMVVGLIVCYTFGTVWFIQVYARTSTETMTVATALSWCVFPFILPDLIKIAIAMTLIRILRPHVH